MPRIGIALFLLLISGSLVFFFLVPQWEQIGTLREEVAQREMLAQDLIELAAKRDQLIAQYNSIPEVDLMKIQELAPVGRQTAKALVDFEALAARAGVGLDQVEFAASETESAVAGGGAARALYAPLTVSMGVRGSYSSLRNFFALLERSIRIFDVTDVSLSGSQDGDSLSMSLRGKIYYQP